MRLSKLATSVNPSATLAAAARARQLAASGVHVFDFTLGEPDQTTPRHICEAAERAMRDGHTHYTPASGLTELKIAIADWYRRAYEWDVTLDRIVISNGAKHAVHNGLAATVNPGDEVIIPTPYWVSYSDLVSMLGAIPVLVPTTAASGFKLTPADYRAARTPRTRLLMLNSPCNPTGAVYSRAELTALVDAVMETDAGILSDEIYEQLYYGNAAPSCVATLRPGLADRTIVVSGASKTYAMTGWRMGWAVAPPAVCKAMADIQSQETGCPSSIAQHATIAALTGPQHCVTEMRHEYARRRQFVCDRLRAMSGIRLFEPDGAFYAFFDVSSYFGKTLGAQQVHDSDSFCEAALTQAHVSFVSGAAFGCEGYVRMSYAAATKELHAGLDAFEHWLKKAK